MFLKLKKHTLFKDFAENPREFIFMIEKYDKFRR